VRGIGPGFFAPEARSLVIITTALSLLQFVFVVI